MNPAMPPEEIRLRISKLEELKEVWRDDQNFCSRQDIRIETLKAVLRDGNPMSSEEIQLRISKLVEKLKIYWCDGPEFQLRQKIRIETYKAVLGDV